VGAAFIKRFFTFGSLSRLGEQKKLTLGAVSAIPRDHLQLKKKMSRLYDASRKCAGRMCTMSEGLYW
jgi:hypothetical protein